MQTEQVNSLVFSSEIKNVAHVERFEALEAVSGGSICEEKFRKNPHCPYGSREQRHPPRQRPRPGQRRLHYLRNGNGKPHGLLQREGPRRRLQSVRYSGSHRPPKPGKAERTGRFFDATPCGLLRIFKFGPGSQTWI